MAAERLSMRKLRELLRQRLELKLSVREIARSLGIGVGTVNRYLYRAKAAKLTSWPLPPQLDDDAALTVRIPAIAITRSGRSRSPVPDEADHRSGATLVPLTSPASARSSTFHAACGWTRPSA
ncbi:sigma-70 region 4 domain-containing protein [Archangium violaceum]|uniref:sigma factor-like helix-turn-helix DNA-binding protein n=1 Tax=Archangium violaceum TaxID=83451 RepID=UPI001951E845|nr:sigma-70 region 4 domain-containing protein [Archangium violaceum]